MKESLLEYVVCPADHRPLRLQRSDTGGAEVVEGTLQCPTGHVYPIRSGVPRLLAGSVAEEVLRSAPCPVLIRRWAPVKSEAGFYKTSV